MQTQTQSELNAQTFNHDQRYALLLNIIVKYRKNHFDFCIQHLTNYLFLIQSKVDFLFYDFEMMPYGLVSTAMRHDLRILQGKGCIDFDKVDMPEGNMSVFQEEAEAYLVNHQDFFADPLISEVFANLDRYYSTISLVTFIKVTMIIMLGREQDSKGIARELRDITTLHDHKIDELVSFVKETGFIS